MTDQDKLAQLELASFRKAFRIVLILGVLNASLIAIAITLGHTKWATFSFLPGMACVLLFGLTFYFGARYWPKGGHYRCGWGREQSDDPGILVLFAVGFGPLLLTGLFMLLALGQPPTAG